VYLIPFLSYSASKYDVTLKLGVGIVQGHWKWCCARDHIRLFIGPPCNLYSSYLVQFLSYLTLNIITLTSGLEVTQGHSKWYNLKAWMQFHSFIAFHSDYGSILHQFRDKAQHWSQIVIFSYPLAFGTRVRAVPVGILPSHLVWKN